MNSWDKCKNCGGDYALHHYQTDQCPVGGREAPFDRKQEWKTTTFEMVDDRDEKIARLTAQRDEAQNALKAICGLLGNVDHSIGNGERSAKRRGDLLNSIREIAREVIAPSPRAAVAVDLDAANGVTPDSEEITYHTDFDPSIF